MLEALSHALPDGTYVTELRITGDKVQVVGMTQDAPTLIRLIERSPQFADATFLRRPRVRRMSRVSVSTLRPTSRRLLDLAHESHRYF